jgi:UDP-galactopyranose mutase
LAHDLWRPAESAIVPTIRRPGIEKVSKAILVVGAGFAGSTYARELAEHGFSVDVIDKRPHVGGNAYDEVAPSGVRIHQYGPHLFHTNNEEVVCWLTRFGDFVPYQHKVQAELADGSCVPLPVNRRTINAVFGTKLEDEAEVRAFLATQAVSIAAPANAAEYLYANIGNTLTELFFRGYTRKMWGHDLEDMDASAVKRVPIRYDDEDRYFPTDRFQILPRHGYAEIFGRILDHPNIRINLAQPFDRSFARGYFHCFNSMPIDEYFDERFGPLPYRSIRFHHEDLPVAHAKGWATVTNFTASGRFTRETDWSRMPAHRVSDGPLKTVTREEPCDYSDNNLERYYPVKTSDGRYDRVYDSYKALAERAANVTFIGRCGTYQYLDMHQVINQSLMGARRWLHNLG